MYNLATMKEQMNCKQCPYFEQSGDLNDSYDAGCIRDIWNLKVDPGLTTGIFPAGDSLKTMARICPYFTRDTDSPLRRILSRKVRMLRTGQVYSRWSKNREIIL